MFFSRMAKKLRFLINGGFKQWKKMRAEEEQEFDGNSENSPGGEDGAEVPITEDAELDKSLEKNIAVFKRIFGNSGDVVIREISFGPGNKRKGAIIYIDGLVNSSEITKGILKPVLAYMKRGKYGFFEDTVSKIEDSVICSDQIKNSRYYSELVKGCLDGDTVLIIDGFKKGLIMNTKGWEKRSVEEPQSEVVVRGPREGFTENFRTNTSLLRRRIKSPQLRMEHMVIGKHSQTKVCIAYIEGIAKPDVVKKLRDRLSRIDVDAILDSSYLEQYIEEAPLSLFSTVGYSEKPDVITAKVMEGRVAIICDGSPFVLTVPYIFLEAFQTAEDYYNRTIYGSFLRIFRYLAFAISVAAPAIFIAVTTFHQELLPIRLILTIKSARESTPFPAFLEALTLVVAFEILKEAGIRLPRAVGQAVSIVGALIIGEAAVSAGLVGAPIVIVVAIASVAEFITPALSGLVFPLRFIYMVCASVFGGFGIGMGVFVTLSHLGALKSYGAEYFHGVRISSDNKDTFIRMPLWKMVTRPVDIAGGDVKRAGNATSSPQRYAKNDQATTENEGK
jgi:spore germination protein KA